MTDTIAIDPLQRFLLNIGTFEKIPDNETGCKLTSIRLDSELEAGVINKFYREYDDGYVGSDLNIDYFIKKEALIPIIQGLKEKEFAEINQSIIHRASSNKYENSYSREEEYNTQISFANLKGKIKLKNNKLDLSELVCELKEPIMQADTPSLELDNKIRKTIKQILAFASL